MNWRLWWTLQFLRLCVCQDDDKEVEKIENVKNCRERNRLITADSGDIYALIDVIYGQKLVLQCHYWYINFCLLFFNISTFRSNESCHFLQTKPNLI